MRNARSNIPQIPSAASLCANTRCPKCRSRRRDGVVLRCDAYRMQERILDLHVDSTQAARRYRREERREREREGAGEGQTLCKE